MNIANSRITAARTAIVTGAAKGLGLAMTLRLLDAGHRVAMVDMDAPALQQAVAGLPRDRVLPIDVSLTDPAAPNQIDKAIRAVWEPASILVNNAGVSPKHNGKAANLEQMSAEEWQFVMDVNVTAPMRMAQCFVPFMREQRWGRVINLSSRAGRSQANAASPAYMTSKAAILGHTRSIASQYAEFGITANSVAPGMVDTPLLRSISAESMALLMSRTPLGRVGKPEEIGAVVAFLASEDGGFITGACIDVNGGAFMC